MSVTADEVRAIVREEFERAAAELLQAMFDEYKKAVETLPILPMPTTKPDDPEPPGRHLRGI